MEEEIIFSKGEDRDQGRPMLDGLFDKAKAFTKYEGVRSRIGIQGFLGSANHDYDTLAGSLRPIRCSQQAVYVLPAGGRESGEKEDLAEEGKVKPASEGEKVGGEAREGRGETASVCHEAAKCPNRDQPVRMISKDVAFRWIQITSFDHLNREIISEVIPYFPLSDSKKSYVFPNCKQMATTTFMNLRLVNDIPNKVKDPNPPKTSVSNQIISQKERKEAVEQKHGNELESSQRLKASF